MLAAARAFKIKEVPVTLSELNQALGVVEQPKRMAGLNPDVAGWTTQTTCDDWLSCAYTVNCGSDTGYSCACKGC